MGKYLYLFLSITFSIFYSFTAQAQDLSEVGLFKRCYSQLTGRPVPMKHPLMLQVKQKTLSALSACHSILDKTEINPVSGLVTDDVEAKWVLNNINDFHRSWFTGNSVEQIQGYNDELAATTRNIFDMTEPGLAVSRAFFTPGIQFKDIVTKDHGVHGIREQNDFVRRLFNWVAVNPSRGTFGNAAKFDENLINFRGLSGPFSGDSDAPNSFILSVPKIETGELKGIRLKTESFIVPNVTLGPLAPAETAGNTQPGLRFQFNLFETMGGGILGSPGYLMANFGHGYGVKMNGQSKLPRRWAKAVMENFLCATLPALRESDIRQDLASGSTAPFRNSNSCLQCHSNLDQMALTARNLVIANTDYTRFDRGGRQHALPAMVMAKYHAEFPSAANWSSEPVENFHRQAPMGRLYFRSFDGRLNNLPVNGIPDLGLAISTTDDFYQCASKRYFEYLTGIRVALYDRKDPRYTELNKNLTIENTADRQFVEKLAIDLKQNQSAKRIMKLIMASDYYRSVNFRPWRSP